MLRSKMPFRIIFEGQSLNNYPTDSGMEPEHGYPWHLVRGRRLALPYDIPAVSGTPLRSVGWTNPVDPFNEDLYTTLEERIAPLIGRDEKTIVIICGATTDVQLGETGAQIHTDFENHALALRDFGADHVIATTIPPATIFDAGMDTARIDANNLLLANTNSLFRTVVDLTQDPVLDDYTDTDYFPDGVHFSNLAAIAMANLVWPHISPIIYA